MRKMITTTAAVLAAAWLVSATSAVLPAAQEKMATFYLCLLVAPSNPAKPPADPAQLQLDHLTNLKAIMASGKGVIAGPIAGDGRLRGILVLRVNSVEEATAITGADPAVKAGQLAVEVHPWFAADGIMKPVFNPADLATYYFGFLNKGPAWTAERTPESQKIQEAHMAHLNESGKSGKLVIAGPLGDNGNIRGILVYKTATIDEAKAIAAADPAVKAGRLAVEMHTWYVSKGALPQADR
ncbi:MAG: YciI family protein [Vicinamibacterales bacterium]|jgi:uncharacterized protein YciI|nr:YciI family protein [Vicinamibacterales bacterium]